MIQCPGYPPGSCATMIPAARALCHYCLRSQRLPWPRVLTSALAKADGLGALVLLALAGAS